MSRTDTPELLKQRTQKFALRIIRLVENLPARSAARTIGSQLVRSGTSVGANYRAACRSRSSAEFCSRLGVVEEECDESIYWMELLIESGAVKRERLLDLMSEANEILAIVVASIRTARKQSNGRKTANPK